MKKFNILILFALISTIANCQCNTSMADTLLTDTPLKDATPIISNAMGQKVKQLNNLNGQSVQIQCDNLPKGLYFVYFLQNGRGVSMGKLVVEN